MKPHFAVCFEGRIAEELRQAGCPPEILGPVRLSRPWTLWQARRRLRAWLAGNRADVVIVHSGWLGAMAGAVPQRCQVPTVFWAHGSGGYGTRGERLLRPAPPALVLANSQWTLDSVHHQFPGASAEVIGLPVEFETPDPSAREALRREMNTPPGWLVVLCVSRLERWKGHTVLIDAISRLRPKARGGEPCGQMSVWVAGSASGMEGTSYAAELRQQARSAGFTDQEFCWLGERRDVANLLSAADLFCQPNTAPEPFGIVFVEAMYARLPVITSDLGGASELLKGSGAAILCPPEDGEAVAEAIRRLILDPALRERMGVAGRRRADEVCRPDRQMRAIEMALRSIVTGAGAVSRRSVA
jgi:glycosyltransferase involved in cell wall biosynthesis